MRIPTMLASTALIALLMAACSERTADTPPSTSPRQSPATPALASPVVADTDAWTGRWLGPEGTYLEIAGNAPAYQVTISNLDGPRSFEGVGAAGTIRFERDGVSESIRRGTGADTGMKWLADKTNCLVVRSGEGYCRDP